MALKLAKLRTRLWNIKMLQVSKCHIVRTHLRSQPVSLSGLQPPQFNWYLSHDLLLISQHLDLECCISTKELFPVFINRQLITLLTSENSSLDNVILLTLNI